MKSYENIFAEIKEIKLIIEGSRPHGYSNGAQKSVTRVHSNSVFLVFPYILFIFSRAKYFLNINMGSGEIAAHRHDIHSIERSRNKCRAKHTIEHVVHLFYQGTGFRSV